MAVTLRLSRVGGKKLPFYRLVATDHRSPRDGRFIEQVGVLDPRRDPPEFRIDADRVLHWLEVGARPSETVGQLLKRHAKGPALEGHALRDRIARKRVAKSA